MAKFKATEDRQYHYLGITVNAGDVVDLPADTDATGLVAVNEVKAKETKPVDSKESE